MPKMCKRQHASSVLPGGRYKDERCKDCVRERNATHKAKAQRIECTKKWRATPNGKTRRKEHDKTWRATPEVKAWRKEYGRMWRATPEGKAWQKKRDAKRRATPEGKAASQEFSARRRARKRQQTCTCCRPKDIRKFYEWAYALRLEVDHVIPLALGGLHCCKNLQELTPEEHKQKTARDLAAITEAKRATVLSSAEAAQNLSGDLKAASGAARALAAYGGLSATVGI